MEPIETTRITITRILTGADGDASDIIEVEVEPADAPLVELLGMLAIAEDTVQEIVGGDDED